MTRLVAAARQVVIVHGTKTEAEAWHNELRESLGATEGTTESASEEDCSCRTLPFRHRREDHGPTTTQASAFGAVATEREEGEGT